MLTVKVENLGEVTALQCVGRIVRGYETALLCSALRQEARNMVLDLTQVDAIDAAGIGALVSLQAAGIYLKLVNPAAQVREVLRVTRLDSILEICESRSGAAIKESAAGGRARGSVADMLIRLQSELLSPRTSTKVSAWSSGRSPRGGVMTASGPDALPANHPAIKGQRENREGVPGKKF